MSYVPIRSGFTGPRNKIGGSTEYHIDLKLLESLPIAERVKAVDTLARQYASIGREIEFSNAAVSGRRWNPNADLSDRVQLLNQVAAAHSHNLHPGWQSLDFYVPFRGKNRFDRGAVEDASIYIPGVPGGSIRRGSGGGFGYFSEALDPSGRVVFRVGHGNVDRPEPDGDIAIAPTAPQLPPPEGQGQQAQQQQGPTEAEEKFLRQYMKDYMAQQAEQQLKFGLMAQMMQRKRKDPFAEFQEFMQAAGGMGMPNPMLNSVTL